MKKLLIPILILPLMFFTGCSEEEETVAGSTDEESYTIDDMVGTWNMVSNTQEGSISMDLSPIVTMLPALLAVADQMYCEELGFTWGSDTCTASDEQIAEIVGDYCSSECDDGLNQDECEDYDCEWDDDSGECFADGEEGTYTLVGNTCTIVMLDEECCEEGQSEVATITSDGAITLVGEDSDDSWTDTGTISVDGTALTLEIDEECECFELDQTACGTTDGCEWSDDDDECSGEYEGGCLWIITGTLSIDGNTATMTMEVDFDEFLEDFMDEDDEYYDYDYDFDFDFDLPMPTGSISQVIVWEKSE